MAENTAISWADHTMNFWWGCTKVGPGCDHCYAETFDRRVGGSHWGPGAPRRLIKDWFKPRKWQREAERTGVSPWVFAQSMADFFDNEVPEEWRERAWQVIRETPALRWIVVTKRIGNAAKMLPDDWGEGYQNVGIVSTVVTQEEADRDVPKLLTTPARWRGLSVEPMLGPLALRELDTMRFPGAERLDALTGELRGMFGDPCPTRLPGLDWVICGGESGPNARPLEGDWVRDLCGDCAAVGTAFHYKQHGEWIDVRDLRNLQGGGGPGFGRFDRCRYDPETDSVRVGVRESGRMLDGVLHDARPRIYDAA